MKIYRIYMDINVFCRPFDDKSQLRIVQEASAFVTILAEIISGNVICIGSDILDFEANNTPAEIKKSRLLALTRYCSEKVIMDESIRNLGNELESNTHLTPRDALHVISAAKGLSDYFLTCDDKVIKKAKDIKNFLTYYKMKLQIQNPVEFVKKITRSKESNE